MEETPPPRSTLITGLAWTAVLCSVLGLLAGSLQCFLSSAMLSGGDLERLGDAGDLPAIARMSPRLHWFGLSSAAGALATFFTAVGLMRRRPWARSAFIVLLGMGMAANLVSVYAVRSVFSTLPVIPEGYVFPHFRLLLGFLEGLVYAALAGTTALMGWLIRRLRREDVRREFGAGEA
ncbi:MAG: hypothetical protein A2X36_00545 [Elusimicrobia bacterium GWA2_69_24]|nr:MAG: hypothetical protein A2X36_00545 [Elusimicrobia bacterium GWA2_69_24]HBL16969.1 hypothetical protein [Elusimicrobiota bacterium]